LDFVFVYLVDAGGNHVAFWKGKCRDFAFQDDEKIVEGEESLRKQPVLKWYPLTNNQAVGKIKNHYDSGMVQFKLQIKKIDPKEQFRWIDQDPWKVVPKPMQEKKIKIRCFIYQAKDLPSADSDGGCDPYARIFNPMGTDQRTRVIQQNLNPLFYDTKELVFECNAVEDAPPITITLWDRDTEIFDFDGDDFLGRVVIDVAKLDKA